VEKEKYYIEPEFVEETFGVAINHHAKQHFYSLLNQKTIFDNSFETAMIYRVGQDGQGKNISIKYMDEYFQKIFDDNFIGYESRCWYSTHDFYTAIAPRNGVAVTTEIHSYSLNKNYLAQTRLLKNFLQRLGRIDHELLNECRENLAQTAKSLAQNDYASASQFLHDITINKIFRPSPVEVIYDCLMLYLKYNIDFSNGLLTWTNHLLDDTFVIAGGMEYNTIYLVDTEIIAVEEDSGSMFSSYL
jgi:hypothetical protein